MGLKRLTTNPNCANPQKTTLLHFILKEGENPKSSQSSEW